MSVAALHVMPRTEIEVAADAVAAILASGLVKQDAVTVAALAHAVHVPVATVRDAWRRHQDGRYQPPTLRPVDTTVPDVPANLAAANLVRHAKKNPAPGLRRCSRCAEVKPDTDFGIKNPRTGQLRSMCRPCFTAYQRTRYLSVQKVNLMNAVGLTFTVGADDDVHNLVCVDCGCPILVGDEVHGTAALTHVACPVRR